jgi:hypothetical protein
VALRSARPDAKPRIYHNYLATDHDRMTLIASVRLATDLFAQPNLSKVRRAPFSVPASDAEADIVAFVPEENVRSFLRDCDDGRVSVAANDRKHHRSVAPDLAFREKPVHSASALQCRPLSRPSPDLHLSMALTPGFEDCRVPLISCLPAPPAPRFNSRGGFFVLLEPGSWFRASI